MKRIEMENNPESTPFNRHLMHSFGNASFAILRNIPFSTFNNPSRHLTSAILLKQAC